VEFLNGFKIQYQVLIVDVSLKPLRYVTGVCAIPYILHVEMDTHTHGKLEKSN
jgi:hypothetical protein